MSGLLRRKRLVIGLAVTLAVAALLVVSNFWLYLWQISGAQGTFSMAPALPACNGQTLVEGFTYHFRDPHRGEIVSFHARGEIGGEITPDPDSRQLQVNKRVIGVPGDTVVDGTTASMSTDARQTTSPRFPSRPSISTRSSTL